LFSDCRHFWPTVPVPTSQRLQFSYNVLYGNAACCASNPYLGHSRRVPHGEPSRRARCRKSARPVVRPAKAGMFSRRQTCRGNSQAPRSSDSRVAGNQDSEAYRQGLPWGDHESPGRNEDRSATPGRAIHLGHEEAMLSARCESPQLVAKRPCADVVNKKLG
jgi:hypothetical protein